MRRNSLAVVAVLLLCLAAPAAAAKSYPACTCGVERAAVKGGTDHAARAVDTANPVAATVAEMGAWPVPSPNSEAGLGRAKPHETTAYMVVAYLTAFKLEKDCDYHLVLTDGAGNTVIAEIPAPMCAAGSPWLAQIRQARADFEAQGFHAGTVGKLVHLISKWRVRVTGVGMFDRPHGQDGMAPNAIELHPVLAINFD